MEIIVVSAVVSFIVTLIMMKWHIYNIKKIYDKYFILEESNIKHFAEIVIDRISKC